MIRVSNFLGVDKKNENQQGTLPAALNADFGNPIGRIRKRPGLYKIAELSGEQGINGQFTYKHDEGEIALFAYDNKVYKLTPETKSISVDFSKGEYYGCFLYDGERLVSEGEIEEIYIYEAAQEPIAIYSSYSAGQTFKIQRNYVTKISVYSERPAGGGLAAWMRLLDKNNEWQIAYSDIEAGWVEFDFGMVEIDKNNGMFEVATGSTTPVFLDMSRINPYTDGYAYLRTSFGAEPIMQAGCDLKCKINTHYGLNSYWVSEVYDLGSTPGSISIEFGDEYGVKKYVRVSSDKTTWGEWVEIGDVIPKARYIQLKVVSALTDINEQWYLESATIEYETGGTYPNKIKDLDGTAKQKVRFDTWRGKCYFCDGNKNYVYDGENIRTLGIEPPTQAPTVTATGEGDFSGKYKYKITFVNTDGHESNPSPASEAVTASNNSKFELSGIPTKEGHKRRIYRTKKDIDVYYYINEIDEDDTTYEDTKADDLLVLEMEEDNDIPPAGKILCFHKNYLFIVPADDDTKLRYCKVTNPDASPKNFYKQLPGKISSIKSYSDQLIVSGELFTVAYSGNIFHTTLDDTVQREISNTGALSHEGVVECLMSGVGVVLVMPTVEGYKYLTPGLHEFSLIQRPFSYEVNEYFERCIKAGLAGNICAVEHENVLYIALTYYDETETEKTKNNYILPYSLLTKKWYDLWDIPASGFQKLKGQLLCGSSMEGIIYEMLRGNDDAGKDISFMADIPVNLGHRMKFRKMRLVVGKESVTDTLTVKHQVDTSSKTTQTTPGPVSEWNPDILGHFGMVTMKSKVMYPKLKTGNYYIARVEDKSKSPFSIYAIEVEEG